MENQLPTPKSTFAVHMLGRDMTSYSVYDLAKGTPDSVLENLHEYAVLSDNVYVDSDVYEQEWSEEEVRFALQEWQQIVDLPPEPPTPSGRKKVPGLAYEVWEKRTDGKIRYAIVFRGTEKGLTDWKANLRWLTTKLYPSWWDQYHQVQAMIGHLTADLAQRAESSGLEYEIIATGHSLGGGLAQQAAYASDKIKLVFAFDPSPVTGYYDIKRSTRKTNKEGIVIYRVYEHGEFLAYVRLLMKAVYPAPLLKVQNPRLIQIRYNLLKYEGVASQHSMRSFARWLHWIKMRG